MSFQVIIQPSKHQFPVEPGQTVLDAAWPRASCCPTAAATAPAPPAKARWCPGSSTPASTPRRSCRPKNWPTAIRCSARRGPSRIWWWNPPRFASPAISRSALPSRVQTMERAAPDVAVLKLQLPASEQFRYYAGQYVEVILKDGRRRSYSMAGAPHTGSPLELHIRHMPGGLFTDHVFGAGATQMKEREILRLEGRSARSSCARTATSRWCCWPAAPASRRSRPSSST